MPNASKQTSWWFLLFSCSSWTCLFTINYKPCWNTVCLQSQEEAVMYQMEASKARPSCYVDDLSPRAQNLDLEQHNSIHWHWVYCKSWKPIANFSVILYDLYVSYKMAWSRSISVTQNYNMKIWCVYYSIYLIFCMICILVRLYVS